MNDATRELLLKLRKNATSAWGPKQYVEAFTALGFEVQTHKQGRSITAVTFTAPNGAFHRIEKRPDYRVIVFYTLSSWLKEAGYDVVAMSSAALGLDTPDVERAKKDLYERDLTNTGTCPVCGGNFKRDGTGIGHHGFKRPGDGMLHGACFAVGYLPWELSPIGAQEYITLALEPTKARAEKRLEMLTTGQITEFMELPPSWKTNALPETITKELDPERFARKLALEIVQTERYIAMLNADIKHFRAKVAGWAPDELPEFKHAGKFKVA